MKKIIFIMIIILIINSSCFTSLGFKENKEEISCQSMRIEFYEEFPNEENLSKAELIDFSSTIFIAAYSLEDFYKAEQMLKKYNPDLEAGYWVLMKESYFISPFSLTYELQNLIEELKNNKQNETLKIMLDLEPPGKNFIKKHIKNISFFKNKNLIKYIIKNSKELNIEIHTSEFPYCNRFEEKRQELLGFSYSLDKFSFKKYLMFYYTWYINTDSFLKNFLLQIKRKIAEDYIIKHYKKYGDNLRVGVGIIAHGINPNETVISPEILDKNLDFLYKNGIKTACIFRLGGLNESYVNVIKKYV